MRRSSVAALTFGQRSEVATPWGWHWCWDIILVFDVVCSGAIEITVLIDICKTKAAAAFIHMQTNVHKTSLSCCETAARTETHPQFKTLLSADIGTTVKQAHLAATELLPIKKELNAVSRLLVAIISMKVAPIIPDGNATASTPSRPTSAATTRPSHD